METRVTIYRDNAVVVNGNLNNIDVSKQKDRQRVKLSGAITLPDSLEPGDYTLQITVIDPVNKQTARQLLPFEIVK